MSGVARLLLEWGCAVSGSDAREGPELDALRGAGVRITVGASASAVDEADVVLFSPAVPLDHVELAAARACGATVVARAELLGELARGWPVVGLTGTHGKTTATSMMVHVLAAAGRDAARLVGAPVLGVGANGHWGPDGLVLEVDESYGSFAALSPAALGVLNVEADHLDHYGTLAVLEVAFADLIERTTGPVVVWGDDEGAARVAAAAARSVVTVATGGGDWRVDDVALTRRGATFSLVGSSRLEVMIRVPGAHNVANAAVVGALALELGVERAAVAAGLAAFVGAPRRFQRRGSWRGVDVYEDYAHLPGEVRATLAALRAIGYRRVTAAFQPHRVTRSVALADAFAPAFDEADRVVVTDLYSAGEANPDHVTGEIVADPLRARRGDDRVRYAPDRAALVAALADWHDDSDVLVLLGAGDVADVVTDLEGGLT